MLLAFGDLNELLSMIPAFPKQLNARSKGKKQIHKNNLDQ
jgi:hypothetical protein